MEKISETFFLHDNYLPFSNFANLIYSVSKKQSKLLRLVKFHKNSRHSSIALWFMKKKWTFDFVNPDLRVYIIKTPLIVWTSISTVFSGSQKQYY